MEVVVVLLEVYYHHGHIVLAVVVRASLISYLLGNLVERHALLSELVNHFGHFLFTVHEVEAV